MGQPVHFQEEPRSRLVTIYCVQAYWRDREKLAKGRFQQFGTEAAARGAGKAAALRNAGVVVFSVRGSPEADYWEEPMVLAIHGEKPLA